MAKTRRQQARSGPVSSGGEKNNNPNSGNPKNSSESASMSISNANSDVGLSTGNSENTTRLIADSMNVNAGTGIGNPDDVNCNMDRNKLTAAGTNNCNRCNDNDAVNGGVNGDKGMEEAGSVIKDRIIQNNWLNVIAGSVPSKTCTVSNETHVDAPVKIDLDDIDEELVYWSSAMVVYVLGANPPFSVFNGYCHRIWGKKGLDKVLLVGKGLYLVRFNSVEQREQIWNDEPKFFDSKPVIMKKWDPDMELHKETIKTVPIWIRFPKLELKYWGHRSLHKLGDAIGTTLKVDRLTEQKERLAYARIMVEVDIQKELPDQIEFINEKGISMVQLIEYEWRPNFCSKCNKYGHRGEECSKGVRKEMAWKPKTTSGPPSDQQQGCPRITNPGQQQSQTGQNPDRMGQQQKTDRMGQQQPPQHMLQGPMSDETEGVVKGSCRPLLQTRSSAEQQRPKTTQQQQLSRANNGADVHGQAQSHTAIQTKVSTGNVQGVDIGDIGEFTPVHEKRNKANGNNEHHTPISNSFGVLDDEMEDGQTGRTPLWDNLREFSRVVGGDPWCVTGDFNAIMNKEDRQGAVVRWTEIQPMIECVNVCGLEDMKSSGRFFTWSNKQEGAKRVLTKIDRALCNGGWCNMVPTAETLFLPENDFDHTPMVIRSFSPQPGRKPFRFFNYWCTNQNFLDTVMQVWGKQVHGYFMFQVMQKLKWLKAELKQMYSQDVIANYQEAKTTLEETQSLMHQYPQDPILATMEKQATETFKGATKSYNSWLKQKAKIHWLQDGDTNSKIFFNSLRVRTCRNNINRVQNTHGIWVEDHDSITRAFTDFYTDLLQGSDHNRRLVIKDIVRMGSTLNNDHRSMLDCTFSDKEIKQAIFSIPSNKAPGLDGYNSCFFKEAWSVVGQDVIRAVREFFASGKLLKEVSVTTLTMVPKVQTPNNVGDYRPIACCSTIYKCISKLLCSKLRAILPDIISPNQGAFVTGRSIMHNALICQDMMRFYRPSQIQDCCMFKLDVKKAYDTVSWGFMNDIMTELGFPEHFIRLIMVCITSPQYTLMINGVPSPLVTPSRGLRQGDPLSPLLFTLCMEYFTRVMKKVSLLPGYRFHPLCRQLQLNHLCFADDILMFSRGDINTVTMNLAGLELFSQSTGLMISAAKSEFFCAGVDSNTIQRIKALSGFSLGRLPFTYLGIPMSPKQIHPSDCEKLTDKMCARIKM
ncbi:LINE-1 retrotransposable element ORF2 protein [Bienertia sinuspersici]